MNFDKPKKPSNFPFLPKDRRLLKMLESEAKEEMMSANRLLEKILKNEMKNRGVYQKFSS